ncbi:MAG: globin [Acidimicrobiales bacterium]
MSEPGSLYEVVGGEGFFVTLVDRFYDAVALDPVLRPLYPDDLTESRRNLAGFLVQYWGGPATYSDERGHPRLRMRHMPFRVGEPERDAWLEHMMAALDGLGPPEPARAAMIEYFRRTAEFLRNDEGM